MAEDIERYLGVAGQFLRLDNEAHCSEASMPDGWSFQRGVGRDLTMLWARIGIPNFYLRYISSAVMKLLLYYIRNRI